MMLLLNEGCFQILYYPQIELALAYGCAHSVSPLTLVKYIRQSGAQNTLRINRLGMSFKVALIVNTRELRYGFHYFRFTIITFAFQEKL